MHVMEALHLVANGCCVKHSLAHRMPQVLVRMIEEAVRVNFPIVNDVPGKCKDVNKSVGNICERINLHMP